MNENNHDAVEIGTEGDIAKKGSAWSRFWRRFTSEPPPTAAHRLYSRLVQHARFPLYYQRLGAPDTPEGRFEILALHVGLTVRRLGALGDEGRALAQELFDLMVADLDMNLRELGVGDLSVGRQVKRLAGQFYARLAVLNEAFDGRGTGDGKGTGDEGAMEALAPMLITNIHGGASDKPDRIAHLIAILAALEKALGRETPGELLAGRLTTLPDETALKAFDAQQADVLPAT